MSHHLTTAPTHHGATHAPTHHGATHAPHPGATHNPHSSTAGHTGASAHGDKGYEMAILFVSVALFIGVLARWIITRYKINLPYTVVLLLLGLLIAAIPADSHLGNLGHALDSARNIDPHLLLGTLIPALIFESAFATDYHIVAREFVQCLVLAGPGVVINTALTGAFAVFVFPYGWTWYRALLFGAIVSATDPVAVVALLRDLGASKRLATLIEGESLLNDGTAFVAYSILLAFVSGNNPSLGKVIGSFGQLTFGGVFTGIGFGLVVQFWLRNTFNDEKIEITITILSCYLCFHVAENEIGGSGVLAVVFLGLVCSKYKSVISPSIEQSMEHVWESLSYVANTIIFLLAGVIIMIGVNNDHGTLNGADFFWLFIIYIGIHITRAITLVVVWPCLYKCGYGLSVQEGVIMWYGALRGAIGLALAMLTKLNPLGSSQESKEDLRFKDLIMFHTCGIVLLTLLVNATTIKYIVQYFKMDRPTPKQAEVLIDTMKHLRARTEIEIRAMKDDPVYRGCDWNEVIDALPNYGRIIRPDIVPYDNRRSCASVLCMPCSFVYGLVCKKEHNSGFSDDVSVQLLAPAALHVQGALRESREDEYKAQEIRLDSARYGLDDDGFDIREYMAGKGSYTTHGVEYDMDILNQRILTVMKHSYWASYEHAVISRPTVVVLMDAVETALDTNDLSVHLRKVRDVFTIPKLLRRWFEAGSCHLQARRVLTQKILSAMEVGQQFDRAIHKVKHLLNEELEEFADNERVQFSLTVLDDHSSQIGEMTHELQIIYPELTRAIQTRQAAQHIIHLEHRTAHHMNEEGLIDEGEYAKMITLISESENDLQNRSFTSVTVSSDDILSSLPFMGEPAMPSNLKKRVLGAERHLIERGYNVYTGGDKATGGIVISRGRAELRYANRTIDTFTSGTFLAYDFFAGRPHLGDCVASTPVEYYHIDGSVMNQLVEHPELEASVWRSCATMLIRSYFMDDLGIREHIDVGRLCAVAEFRSTRSGEGIEVQNKALLLTGVALKPNAKQPVLAPSVLLPLGSHYTFDQNAKVLLFDRDVAAADDERNPVLSRFRLHSGARREKSPVPPNPPPSHLLVPMEH